MSCALLSGNSSPRISRHFEAMAVYEKGVAPALARNNTPGVIYSLYDKNLIL
jgi:hypothetical protein